MAAPSRTIFPTLEEAALGALVHAIRDASSADRGRLRVGKVQRVAGGYVYTAAQRSRETVWSQRRQIIRYKLGASDVATYVVHPRSGNWRLDRRNERPNRGEKRIVDRLDPEGRPLYLLTPTLRVVRYDGAPRSQSLGCLVRGKDVRMHSWPVEASVGHGMGRPRCPEPSAARFGELAERLTTN